MRKQLGALGALGAAMALSVPASAQPAASGVTIYGIADAALTRISNQGGAPNTVADSGRLQSSRLGFRGREDLGGGLAAVFTLEHGFNIDSGAPASATTFFNRQSWVGLQSSRLGTLTAGLQYTPVYDNLILLAPVVTFGGHAGAVDGVALPTSAPGRYDNTLGGSRVANSLKYHSPRYAGWRLSAMYGAGEVAGSSTAGRLLSAGVGYAQGPVSGGLVHLRSECRAATGCTPAQATNRVWVGGAGYNFKVARVSAIVSHQENARNVRGNEATVYSVLGSVPLGSWLLSAGYSVQNDKSANNWDVAQVNLGAQYYLSKRTTLYGFWSGQKVDNGGKAHMLLIDSSDSRQAQYGIGVRHVF